MSSSVEDLLRSIREEEKRLKVLREAAPTIVLQSSENRAAMSDVLVSLMKNYESFITNFIDHCDDNTLSHMWKVCFYRQIEDYRQTLKQVKAASESFDAQKPSHPTSAPNFKHLLAYANESFDRFLQKGNKFFQTLVRKLEDAAALTETSDTTKMELLMKFVYKCCIYMGDLLRYKELYSVKEKKDYRESLKHYERAALLMPDIGNAHNQLAVIATYDGSDSTALYHYCRSIMVKSPFSGGFINMVQIYDSNIANYQEFQVMRGMIDHVSNLHEMHRYTMFLCDFVHLHGYLFAWSVRMHLDYLRTVSSPSTAFSQSSAESTTLLSKLNDSLASKILRHERELKLEKLHQLTMRLMEDFDWILSEDKLRGGTVPRITVVCIFAIHFAEMPDAALLANSDGSFSQFLHTTYDSQRTTFSSATSTAAKVERTTIQSQALSLLYGIVSRTAMRVVQAVSTLPSPQPAVLNIHLLSLILLFLLWLEQHPEHLLASEEIIEEELDIALPAVFSDSLSMDDGPNVPQQTWKRKFCVNREQGRYEQRTRSNLRSAMAQLCDILLQIYPDIAEAKAPMQTSDSIIYTIRHLVELRGFLPFGDSVDELFRDFHPLKQQIEYFGVEVAKAEVTRLIYQTIRRVFKDRDVTAPTDNLDATSGKASDTASSAAGSTRPARQLFDPHADTKSMKASTNAMSSNGAKKNTGGSKKNATPHSSSQSAAAQQEGVEKKRAKLHDKQTRGSSITTTVASSPDMVEANDSNEHRPIDVADAVPVNDTSFTAANYTFFSAPVGPVVKANQDLSWDIALEEVVEDNSFEQLNQSISSEIGGDVMLPAGLSGAVPSLTELIRRQAGVGPLSATTSPYGLPSSRGSMSANQSQDRLSSYLSPAVSLTHLSRLGQDDQSQQQQAQSAKTFSQEQGTRHTIDEDDEDFEDVVFRPAFPKDLSNYSDETGILDMSVDKSQHDILDISHDRRDDIWAQFGISSSAPQFGSQHEVPLANRADSIFSSLPSNSGAVFPGTMADIVGIQGLGSGWESDLLLGAPSGLPPPTSSDGSDFTSSFVGFNTTNHNVDSMFGPSLGGVSRSGWGESSVSLMLGTGKSASSAVADISTAGPPPGLQSSGSSTAPAVSAPPPPGLKATLSQPPGLSAPNMKNNT